MSLKKQYFEQRNKELLAGFKQDSITRKESAMRELKTFKILCRISYRFPGWEKIVGSVRLGVITLINQFDDNATKIRCRNGGGSDEVFNFSGGFDHTAPASKLVSSSRGLGATTGEIAITNNCTTINLRWDPSECAVMPMLQNIPSNTGSLSRVFFSTKEVDDSVKL